MTPAHTLPAADGRIFMGACTKHWSHLAMDDQKLDNFRVEKALPVYLRRFAAIVFS
jgi:hypothetical protein